MATENVRAALKQTRLCKYWSSNRCMMGESCNFAHSHQELRATPDLVATKLCFQWSSKGRCKKGSACTFAHGKHQLRQPDEKKPNPTRISWEPMKVMLEPGSWIWKHQRVEVCDLGFRVDHPCSLRAPFLPESSGWAWSSRKRRVWPPQTCPAQGHGRTLSRPAPRA
ncbi:unnamed protein product [Effrenium voratum]|uniref:C3H1-type domain-containing protein n=1 Tax=Effrenium voratum TaxID=2562239 RepID=A0AA36HWL3_9DINO|nr:unnamed protein product [Effrenium voratum]CAJ1445144.1 unnamed protein product [Effrenium voratum]